MTTKYIVTTTINPPGDAILEFLTKSEWHLIVVGDTKTPHDQYKSIEKSYKNFSYLDPEQQEKLYPELSTIIGWKTIQRRNIGYVEAYNRGAVIIASIDDDNIPYKDWGRNTILGRTSEVDLYDTSAHVFDPLSVTNHNDLWHRGFPIQHVSTKNNVKLMGKANLYIGVQADLWDGDPDIDAIERIAWKPCVKFNVDTPYGSHVISPFNSQNTFFIRDCFPDYCVLPFVGRMDDIFASYLLQAKRPDINVAYNKASVYQARNTQDLTVNMKKEYIGYERADELITLLTANGGKIEDTNGIIPKEAVEFYNIYRKAFKE